MHSPFDFVSLNNTVINVPTYLSLLDSKCIHFCTRLNRSAEYCSDKSHVPWKACVCTHTHVHCICMHYSLYYSTIIYVVYKILTIWGILILLPEIEQCILSFVWHLYFTFNNSIHGPYLFRFAGVYIFTVISVSFDFFFELVWSFDDWPQFPFHFNVYSELGSTCRSEMGFGVFSFFIVSEH